MYIKSSIEEMKNRKRELGWTNQKLADQAGIPVGTLNKIFSGMTRYPRDKTMNALIQALGMDYYTMGGGVELSVAREQGVYQSGHSERRIPRSAYDALPDELKAELIDGKLYYRRSPSVRHQELLVMLASELMYYMHSHGGCRKVLAAPCNVCLEGDDYTVLQPDIFVVQRKEMLRDGKNCMGAPELIMEIVSAEDSNHDYELKRHKYQSAGVNEYWIIDPAKMRIVVYAEERDALPAIYTFDECVESVLYEGFQVDFSKMKYC